ncbi:MAG: hypothetical protein ACLPX8_01440 [Bryobacteraceae bacterium]
MKIHIERVRAGQQGLHPREQGGVHIRANAGDALIGMHFHNGAAANANRAGISKPIRVRPEILNHPQRNDPDIGDLGSRPKQSANCRQCGQRFQKLSTI